MSDHRVKCHELQTESFKDNRTLDGSFFDGLWPLILDNNRCRIIASKPEEHFVPQEPFPRLKWHAYLAQVGYPGYDPPHEVRCGAKEPEEECGAAQEVEAQTDYMCHGSQAILPIDQQVDQLRMQQERRQRLAYQFANRRFPWTMQTPSHELGFTISAELKEKFKGNPMELQLLQAIHDHDCHLMIIDLGTEVEIQDCRRWVKFRPYVQLLALCHTARMERSLQQLNVFHTLCVEESVENSWHDELQCSLRTGYTHALKMKLLKACGESLAFVFSRFRGICTCDQFKVIRRT
ncbi:hypothetical protein KR059_009053 [Drosophila kikkawai]|nr:hypothetical protein KR059_009053 [Drosophila kikkawai]